MAYDYDDQNIFAKILRGEIPNQTVLETEHTLAFRDIEPQAPTHVLVIPKGSYVSYDHFAAQASDAEIIDFTRAIAKVCEMEGVTLSAGEGFRMISNAGAHGVQEVPHLHVHILGGRPMGRMVQPAK
ncbi:histidine triad nucleotide-binding protein [Sulfitobacter albidus]|uniref:Histidine triad nucleotide-binding protein n=1 Tax=Sulfitobacter albidus TaxID=2829501 RepID=A0A975PLP0_9RHOB|nr:histidine triad nucleotide-binding protein [Sulfitobacter albidus]QUJ75977.1 histidine triad nucleotide-binding protein [Sulfitobacter albidus]